MMHDAYCMMVNVKDGTIIATRTAFILCWMLQWHDALTQWQLWQFHYNQASDSEKHAAKKFGTVSLLRVQDELTAQRAQQMALLTVKS